MEPIFKNDDLMLRLNAVHKMRKYLQKRKRAYASKLHSAVAFGLNKSEFEWCLKMLEVSGTVTLSEGEKSAVLVIFKEELADTKFYSPEEVIADAQQCPPITEELLSGKTE